MCFPPPWFAYTPPRGCFFVGERVRVRRERPGALCVAFALLLTMLCVYLITLGRAHAPEASLEPEGDAPRVTQEVAFDGMEAYFVALGQYATAEEARIEAARYIPRGAAGYVLETDEGFCVLGAGYGAQAEAEGVADALAAQEGLDCFVREHSAPGVRLRVTAQEAQIARVCEAEALLRAVSQELADIALRLDRAEIESEAARTLVNVASGRLSDAHEALLSIPGARENAVCAGLLTLTEQFRASLFVLSGENSKTTLSLSAKIKYNSIDIALSHMRYLRELNGL